MIRVPGGDFDGLNTYTISVKGDSMVGVGIFDGDVLLIEKTFQLNLKKAWLNYTDTRQKLYLL